VIDITRRSKALSAGLSHEFIINHRMKRGACGIATCNFRNKQQKPWAEAARYCGFCLVRGVFHCGDLAHQQAKL